MEKFVTVVVVFLITFAGVVVCALLMALPTMWLWNALLPEITRGAVTAIGFWQSIGLLLLSGLLVKSTSSNGKSAA